MRTKERFKLHEVADHWIAVPEGSASAEMDFVIKLNTSAKLLWEELEKGVDSPAALAETLLNVYEIDYETALRDCEEFIDLLKEKGFLEL